jgi:hypothetical protein
MYAPAAQIFVVLNTSLFVCVASGGAQKPQTGDATEMGNHKTIGAHPPRSRKCANVEYFATARPDPAEVAAQLRGFVAKHDRGRRLRRALIREIDAYRAQLVLDNKFADAVIGTLRKMAAEHEHDAELVRRQRRLATTKKPAPMREAA